MSGPQSGGDATYYCRRPPTLSVLEPVSVSMGSDSTKQETLATEYARNPALFLADNRDTAYTPDTVVRHIRDLDGGEAALEQAMAHSPLPDKYRRADGYIARRFTEYDPRDPAGYIYLKLVEAGDVLATQNESGTTYFIFAHE